MTDVMCDTNGATKFREGNLLLENGVPACMICSEGASSARDGTEPEAKFTLGQVIGRTASWFPYRPAIVSATFAPLTYHGLQLQLDDIRRQLRLAGFVCNARIGVLMPNGPEAILTIVAVACCSIAVPLDPRLSPAEFHQRLDMLRLNALLVPQGSASEARQAAERRRLAIIEAAPVGNGQLGLNIAVQVSDSPAIDAEPDPGSAWSKLALNSVDLVILRSLVQRAMKRRPTPTGSGWTY
jgi:oxalate---CoA ligase